MVDNSFVTNIRKHNFGDISEHLNWFLEIKDPTLMEDYKAYVFQTRSPLFFLIFSFFMTFVALPGEIALLNEVINRLSVQYQIYSIIYFLIVLAAISSSWIFVLARKYLNISYKFDHMNSTFCLVLLTIMIAMRIIRFSIFPCDLSSMTELVLSRECDGDSVKGLLSWETGGYLMLPPIVYITIIKESRLTIVMSSFFVVLITIAVLCLFYYPWSFSLIFMWGLLGIFLFVDIHLQNIRTYFLKRKLLEIVVANENMNDINQAIEMRHMIANVAHDLKTPLSSFTTGVGLIDQVLKECELAYSNSDMTLEKYQNRLNCLSQYVEDIRNTNSFMLMTINRCIDYTKASKGMKLVPHRETINLLETLKLPLSCMKNIQNRIEIVLNPLSSDICRYIITDKQWLQENVLCLLSNAVKYSSSGIVTITVSLKNLLTDVLPTPHSNMIPMKILLLSSQEEFTTSPLRESITIPDSRSFQIDPLDQLEMLTQSPMSDSLSSVVESDSKYFHPLSKQFLLFEIEDAGIGMTDEAMQSLFYPFKQTQRLAGGTGLGLYSLAKRIEVLGGQYGVTGRRDGKQGSLFWFTIPYTPDNAVSSLDDQPTSEPPTQPNTICSFVQGETNKSNVSNLLNEVKNVSSKSSIQEPESPASEQSNGLSLLLVDDSPSILKLTGLLLKKQKHNVSFAENGAIAVKMIEDRWVEDFKPFDAVLMDLQMPVMDGLEATRRIRQIEQSYVQEGLPLRPPRQLIVGCSANSDNETAEEAFNAGVDAFMAKPFTIESFRKTIETFLPNNQFESSQL